MTAPRPGYGVVIPAGSGGGGGGDVPDADAITKGIVQLAGDLSGTAASPTVPGLTGKTPTSRTISTTAPLTGGGDLSANRTLAVSGATTGAVGVVQLAGDLGGTATAPTVPGLAGKAATSHTHAESDVTTLVSDLAAKAPLASPALTGTPTAPTASAGTSTTQVATTAFATSAVATKTDSYTTQSKTATFTAAPGFVYLIDSTSGAVVVTLPAANVAGQTFAVKWSAGSNTVTLQRAGSDTIGPSATSAVMGLANEVWEFVSSGSGQWNLVGGNKTLTSLDGRYPLRANDLSDLNSASTARTNLGVPPSTRSISTTAPLAGGGDLSADRTFTVAGATTGAVGVVQLTGDLAGTATAPTVPNKATKLTVTTTKTTTYTAGANELIPVNAASGGFTITLPSANVAGQVVAVRRLEFGGNTVTLQRAGSDTIGGNTTLSLVTTGGVTLVSDGAGLWTIQMESQNLTALDGRYPTKSTLTAKGDLYAATASATVARLGVGTDGQRLAADSTQTAGVGWVTPDPPYGLPLISGQYIAPGGVRSTVAMTQSVEYACPVYIANAGTIVRVGLEVTAAGAASTVIRIGIRTDASHLPGTVLLDTTVAGDSITSGVEATVSVAIPAPGIYWFTATAQGGTPTVRSTTGPTGFASTSPTLGAALGATPNGGYITANTVTGALGTYTVSNRAGAMPLIVARA